MKKLLYSISLILLAAYAQAASVNVALDAPVFANGPLYANDTLLKLTDGRRNTQIHADTTPPTGFAYWIDLGVSQTLNEIRIWPRQDACCPDRFSNVRVSVHNDDNDNIGAEVWHADLFTDGSNAGSTAGTNVTVNAGMGVGTFAGRWVKLTVLTDPVPNYALQVNELEVYADGLVNVAVGATVTSSAPLYALADPGIITDGDRGNLIHGDATFVPTDPNDSVFHYDINLGRLATLSTIKIIARQDACCPVRLSNYRVSLHQDSAGAIGAEVWGADLHTDLSNPGSTVGSKDVVTADLDPGGTFAGQWIRISSLDNPVPEYALQMAEVEAYGVLAGPVELSIIQQPQNATGYLGRPHTFSISAVAAAGDPGLITYQWQKNGVNILGATAASYTTPPVTTADETNLFKAVVSYPGLSSLTSDAVGFEIDYAFGSDVAKNFPFWPNGGWAVTTVVDGYTGPQFLGVHADVAPPTGAAIWLDMHTTINVSNIVVWARQDSCCDTRLTNYRLSLHADDPSTGGAEVWGADMHTDGSNTGQNPDKRDLLTADLDPAGIFSARWLQIKSLEDPVPNYALQITEIEVFGSLPPEVKIIITQQPTDTRFSPLRTATFRVTATVLNADPATLTYQWQKDGVNIPGATAATYTTAPLCPDDAGGKFRVILSAPGAQSVTSSEGTLVLEANYALGAAAFSNQPLWLEGGWNIQMLTDGNRGGVFHGDGDPRVEDLQPGFAYTVNLGLSLELEHIDIYPRQDSCCPGRLTNLRVSVHSDSGQNTIGDEVWGVDLFTDGSNPGSAAGSIVTITPDQDPGGVFTGQWIKIQSLEDPVQDYALQMTELEVFGKAHALCAKKTADGKLVLSWDAGTLESAASIVGPWTTVPAAVSPLTISFTAQQQFYRLAIP